MIQCHKVSKSFGDHKVIKDISCDIHTDMLTAITGTSGCGKTTLLNLIGGLDTPTEGSVKIFDTALESLSAKQLAIFRNAHFGYVFQNHLLIDRMSALENVILPLIQRNYSSKKASPLGLSILDKLGLIDFIHHTPEMLSSGQKQRVAIARALVGSPKIILADEPTGALDSHNSYNILQILKELTYEGIAVVLITHDNNISEKADQQIQMRDGVIDAVV